LLLLLLLFWLLLTDVGWWKFDMLYIGGFN
jgi:hypothetical protein